MSFLKEASSILDKTAKVLNEAAFGDIRNIFNNGSLYTFMTAPIGLLNKSYPLMLDHINRNIGNMEYVYDGYSTPIGEVANPFYNSIVKTPWFYLDGNKNSTANYIDYMRNVYGATISVENINEVDLFHISDEAASVGVIEGQYAIEALINNTLVPTNNNGTGTDTYLGESGAYYNRETLRNAVVANNKLTNSITEQLSGYYGITTKNLKNLKKTKSYAYKVNEKTGRIEDILSPLNDTDSPVYVSNYGHYNDIGAYSGFYNSLSDKSKVFFDNSIKENKYRINSSRYVDNTKRDSIEIDFSKDYINSMKITPRYEYGIKGPIRYIFKSYEKYNLSSNASDVMDGGVYVYTENEKGSATTIYSGSFNSGAKFTRYTSYSTGLTANDILKKTNDAFKKGEYKTIIARFHTDSSEDDMTDTTQTAVSKKYGLSHGRNLLKLSPDDSEGYENPYCRVWTFHHQYHRLKDAIRPLGLDANDLYNKYGFKEFTADHSDIGFDNGRQRLERFGTLNKNNGLVNITPIDNGNPNKKVDIKNCMFSIENLAWKGAFSTDAASRETFQAGGLSSEQKGPFGGRIMWFPPYDLKFNEDVSVNWNENNFIGRGEGIYTYTNTTRTGNLSFKILIDHPSIINYWENKGKSGSNSVDETKDPEQEILRFFAGCDMLTAKPSPESEEENAVYDEAIPSPDVKELKFYVFFPNNYSGKDDDVDFAMKYLTNGLGAGKEKRWHYSASKGCYMEDKTTDYDIQYAKTDNGYGGYEMRPDKPISIIRSVDETTYNNGFIADIKVGNYGNGLHCNDGKTSLYVQEGDSTNTWWERKWYYRVDNDYKNQLLKKESYTDSASYCLNSKSGLDIVAKHFSIEDTDYLFSLADVYVALEGGDAVTVLEGLYDAKKVNLFKSLINRYQIESVECVGTASVQGHDKLNNELRKDRAFTVKNWLCKKSNKFDANTVKATPGEIGGEGSGINNGDESSLNNKLWRSTCVTIKFKTAASNTIQNSTKEQFMTTDPNTPIDSQTSIDDMYQTNYKTGNTEQTYIDDRIYFDDRGENELIAERALKDRVKSIRMNALSDNINRLAFNVGASVRGGNVNLNSLYGAVADFSEHYKYFNYDSNGYIVGDRGKSGNILNQIMTHNNDTKAGAVVNPASYLPSDIFNDTGANNVTEREGTKNNKPTRYDNEAKFFSMLEKEEPFLHHKISDKIKYFDPAFHSISPEGFNARLTFLQQCTRQGPTIGQSDNFAVDNTANNLSFGRPPVCILRIGDFYYTKILIDSLSISYDPLMWDLNTEGIGVMPMIADINMRFKFIGGSSLAGHITRLQNALSFNYYANTEVYDDRAELADYDEDGNITKLGTKNLTV